MNPNEELEKLAKSNNLKTNEELNLRLTELKSSGYGILQCILYVRLNRNCSLKDAKSIAINSSARIDVKEDFIKHQEEQTPCDEGLTDLNPVRECYFDLRKIIN